MILQQALKQLYTTFSSYSPSDMKYCTCGCINPKDVQQLASKPLKELTEDDLSSYHSSALYTWGTINHYKHFLPRILEVCQEEEGRGLLELDAIIRKLEYASWDTWQAEERKAIKDFIWVSWLTLVYENDLTIQRRELANYYFFFDLEVLLPAWETSPNTQGLTNFVHFFYKYGNRILNKGLLLRKERQQAAFLTFIQQKKLMQHLEAEFFRVEEQTTNYATQVATVAQLIEQYKSLLPKG